MWPRERPLFLEGAQGLLLNKRKKQQRKTSQEYRSSQSIVAVVRSPPLLLLPLFLVIQCNSLILRTAVTILL
jgi:hypothetical protein